MLQVASCIVAKKVKNKLIEVATPLFDVCFGSVNNSTGFLGSLLRGQILEGVNMAEENTTCVKRVGLPPFLMIKIGIIGDDDIAKIWMSLPSIKVATGF